MNLYSRLLGLVRDAVCCQYLPIGAGANAVTSFNSPKKIPNFFASFVWLKAAFLLKPLSPCSTEVKKPATEPI